MTHASPPTTDRHDTLQPVTGKSGRGTARQTIRMDEDLWNKLGEAASRAGADRSDILRRLARWYVREPNTELPQRPEPPA
jgi:hypothetical protein